MIRIQKKAEQAKKDKAAEEAAAAIAVANSGTSPCEKTLAVESSQEEEEGGLSLLGIGGKQIKTGNVKKTGKKRTPGEIRIQKGKKCTIYLNFGFDT